MNDEQYYRIINDEIKENRINEATWLKALVEAKRDTEKAKYIYVKLRVAQLKGEDYSKMKNDLKRKVNDNLESVENWLKEHTRVATTINISAIIVGKGFFTSFKDGVLGQGMSCSVKTSEIELETKHGKIFIPTNTITKINIVPTLFRNVAEISTTNNGVFKGKLITRYLEVEYKDGLTYSGQGLDLHKISCVNGNVYPEKKTKQLQNIS